MHVGPHPVLEGLTAEQLGANFVHGYNPTPPGAEVVLSLPGDKAVIYVDRASTGGTIMAHAGINFMNYIVEDTEVREMIPRLIAWINDEAEARSRTRRAGRVALVTKRLGILYGGSLPEHRVLADERFSPWFASTIYVPDLTAEALAELDGLYVPEGSNHRRLQAASDVVGEFLARGGTVLAVRGPAGGVAAGDRLGVPPGALIAEADGRVSRLRLPSRPSR